MSPPQDTAFEIMHGGKRLRGFVAAPDGAGPHPAVMMFPGAVGAGPSFRRAVHELADTGYLTVGVSMYGVEDDAGSPQAAGVHFEALMRSPGTLRERVVAWFDAVRQRQDVDPGRIAALGYCFGGKCVLELARSGAALRSVTSFHGLLTTHSPIEGDAFAGRIAVWTGEQDPYAPPDDLAALRAEMEAADVDYQVTTFARAQHSSTDRDRDGYAPGIAYDALAHRISWAGTLTLLEHGAG